MEVTTFVFGTEYPQEMLKHADVGFLQRRVRVEKCTESLNPFIITLRDPHIKDLANRLSENNFQDRFLEVVLNPCLKNEYVTDLIIKRMQGNPNALQMIVENKTLKNIVQDIDPLLKDNWFSRLDFVHLFQKISPLFALIVFRHDKLSHFFLKLLKEKKREKIRTYSSSCNMCQRWKRFL